MGILSPLKNLLSFLTVFPVNMDENLLTDCARHMWAFPLIGALLGLISGAVGWVVLQFIPSLVVGAISLALLLWLTGLHHTDGLLDFGDGLMVHGSAEKKIAVMHDQLTGAGAIGLTLMTYLVTAFAFAEFGKTIPIAGYQIPLIIPGLIIVELCAKLSMVAVAWLGKSVHQGMNSAFLVTMHGAGGNWRLIAALVVSFGITLPLLGWGGLFVVAAAILTGLVLTVVAHRNFKGVTGDVFGATNELTRMVCAVVLLAVITWV
ncbi:MAG: adenosylcobinamide-GDP ribazoletransferase [Nitrososphaerota archaeon]|jgi:adenosylcobinamide-GDP ribazoletransferase|nr:adenosylcobinamide-GDP ribazoletransferase [Nitrososphaerota archaeon]